MCWSWDQSRVDGGVVESGTLWRWACVWRWCGPGRQGRVGGCEGSRGECKRAKAGNRRGAKGNARSGESDAQVLVRVEDRGVVTTARTRRVSPLSAQNQCRSRRGIDTR